MKIGLLHFAFMYSGGGERVAIEQARQLRARGHDVKVVSPITYWDKCFPELLKEVKPERLTPHFPFPWPFREASALLASAILPLGLRRLADRDILLCHSQPSMWIGYRMKKLLGIPYVGYLHQLTTFIHPRSVSGENWRSTSDFMLLGGLLGGLARPAAKAMDRLCHQEANKLIFNSCYTRDKFQRAYGLSGEVCYPGCDVPVTPTSTLNRTGLLCVSRNYPWKRLDLALKISAATREKLTIAGASTSHTENLKRLASQLDIHPCFTGFIPELELNRLYNKSKVYMQTSIEEPFGMGSIEAQAHGLPAVAWDDGGVAETIVDGETGMLARNYNLEDFVDCVRLLYNGYAAWDRMSREAKIWASTFTWNNHVDQVEHVLDEQRP